MHSCMHVICACRSRVVFLIFSILYSYTFFIIYSTGITLIWTSALTKENHENHEEIFKTLTLTLT